MLVLGIHYLTGYATVTDTGSRERAEWPPHPARVFMALVAAHYEGRLAATSDSEDERVALEWLEALSPPAMKAAEADTRTVVTHYVPVNDKIFPPNQPNRQPRTFPKLYLHDPNVFLFWSDASGSDIKMHRPALSRLCEKVTRIGHSSSLVQMWLVEQGQEPAADLFPLPEDSIAAANRRRKREAFHLRVTTAGTLQYLDEAFNGDDIDTFFDLKTRIATVKGKQSKALKAQFQERFGVPFATSVSPPNRAWPTLALTRAYTREKTTTMGAAGEFVAASPFDSNLLILTKLDGPVLGLEATAQLTEALRGAILKTCAPDGNAPEWLCGHGADGTPARRPHLALIPLAFAGHEHADGHLLGIALAVPRGVSPRERARFLRPLLFSTDEDGVPAPAIIRLTLGKLGVWTLAQEERPQPPSALRSETWCRPSTTWASITPVVFDRHLKANASDARFTEIINSIADSCERVGLPRPVEIDVDKTSWHLGVPGSAPGRSGFPLLVSHRQQLHVWLRFPVSVEGPVLIGTGRYRGYGLFKPLS